MSYSLKKRKKKYILVTSISAVCHETVSFDFLKNNVLKLKKNTTKFLEKIIEKLVSLGYERVEMVQMKALAERWVLKCTVR